MRRLVTDPVRPDETAIAEAVEVLRGGGVVAYPTDTLYGLAADPFSAAAVARVFEVKGRAAERALPHRSAPLPWLALPAPTSAPASGRNR